MDFAISAPLAPDSGAREDDVRALKIALNRLGHYVPHVEDGMTGIPDRALFDALKSFQRREGLYPNGRMKPGDPAALRLDALTNAQEDSDMKYVWRSVRDSKVRPLHAARGRPNLFDERSFRRRPPRRSAELSVLDGKRLEFERTKGRVASAKNRATQNSRYKYSRPGNPRTGMAWPPGIRPFSP